MNDKMVPKVPKLNTKQKIKKMGESIGRLALIVDEQTTVINTQSHAIEQNKAALETIINWVGAELGEEAVERLGGLMGWTKPDAANEESKIVIP